MLKPFLKCFLNCLAFQVKLLGDRTKKSDATAEQVKSGRHHQSRHGACGPSGPQPQSNNAGCLTGSKGHSMGVQVNVDILQVEADEKPGLPAHCEWVFGELHKSKDEIGAEELPANWGVVGGVDWGGYSELIMACG